MKLGAETKEEEKNLIISESCTLFIIQNSLSHIEKLLEFARLISEKIWVISKHQIHFQRTKVCKILSSEPNFLMDSGYSLE